MIFVSYSHLDKVWIDRFLSTAKPLEQYVGLDIWSDKRLKPGERWNEEIDRAMDRAFAAVLLVSINFLSSDFIANVELPYILAAAEKRKLKVLWVKLTPCKSDVTPLADVQAAAGVPAPLNSMNEYGWMAAFCKVCDDIDDIVKKIETPIINRALEGRAVRQKEIALQVLAKPAWRQTEVLVYPGNGLWYAQSRIAKGNTTANCWFGDKNTKSGSVIKIIALTRASRPLTPGSKHPNLPLNRTKSEEVRVKRA
jgi:hypothetical protein